MFNIEYVITITLINIVLSIINTFTIVITFIILPPTDAFKTYVLYIGNYKLRTVVCQY